MKHHYSLKVVHHKLCHMRYVPLVVIENRFIVLFKLTISLQTSNVMAHKKTDCLYNLYASELESDLRDTVEWGRKRHVDFSNGNTQLILFEWSNNLGGIDVKMDRSILEKKSSFKILGLPFSSKLQWGSYIISIGKTASKKIGALIRSMKFLFPEVALYLYKSPMPPCMEYCCHVWTSAPSCYLELLDKLQKRICRTVGPSFAAFFEPLAH